MQDADIEAMVVFALQRLLSGHEPTRRALVRDLAEQWPDAPALSFVFALTDASARIDATLDRWAETRGAARTGYRTAALLAGDIFAIESGGLAPVSVRDLQTYWRDVDSYFLDL